MKVYILTGFRRRENRRDIRGRAHWRSFGLRVAWRGDSEIVWRRCTACTGGAQWFDPKRGAWGKIPYSIRREKADRTGSPQAAIENCEKCHGVGKHWVALDDDELGVL
jgi:hypothetical protein